MLSPVDLATGKAKDYFYLDTGKLLDEHASNQNWQNEHLFVPAQRVEHDKGPSGEFKLLVDGDIVRVKSEGLVKVNPQDKEGLADILALDNFSEQSLLHTLRVRFRKVLDLSREMSLLLPLPPPFFSSSHS